MVLYLVLEIKKLIFLRLFEVMKIIFKHDDI